MVGADLSLSAGGEHAGKGIGWGRRRVIGAARGELDRGCGGGDTGAGSGGRQGLSFKIIEDRRGLCEAEWEEKRDEEESGFHERVVIDRVRVASRGVEFKSGVVHEHA